MLVEHGFFYCYFAYIISTPINRKPRKCVSKLFFFFVGMSTVGGMFLWWRRVVLLTLRQSHAWGDAYSSMKCDCLGEGGGEIFILLLYLFIFFITEFGFWSFQRSDCVHWVWFAAEIVRFRTVFFIRGLFEI